MECIDLYHFMWGLECRRFGGVGESWSSSLWAQRHNYITGELKVTGALSTVRGSPAQAACSEIPKILGSYCGHF